MLSASCGGGPAAVVSIAIRKNSEHRTGRANNILEIDNKEKHVGYIMRKCSIVIVIVTAMHCMQVVDHRVYSPQPPRHNLEAIDAGWVGLANFSSST